MTMKLLIEPLDVMLFRDGRAYNAGEDHVASSVFPPPASVIQGVLRTSYLVQNDVDLTKYANGSETSTNEAIGNPGDEEVPFRIRGPFVARLNGDNCELLFPWPADLAVINSSAECVFASPTKKFGDKPTCSLPEGLLPIVYPEDVFGDSKFALSSTSLTEYLLRSKVPVEAGIERGVVVKSDPRVGLGLRSGVKTAQEGLLYSVSFSSLSPKHGIVVEIEDLSLNTSGLIRIGGEGRAAAYSQRDWATSAEPEGIREKVKESGKFTLYFATPALFQTKQGLWSWKPDDWTIAGLPCNAKLVGFACAGYSDYGGWNLVAKYPRPTKRCVNAGSVYFFDCGGKLEESEINKLFEQRWFQAMPGKYQNLGIGITLIGAWDYV